MNVSQINIIISSVEVNCPLCNFSCNLKKNIFRCRSRTTLRNHLQKEHTESEIENYVKKIL